MAALGSHRPSFVQMLRRIDSCGPWEPRHPGVPSLDLWRSCRCTFPLNTQTTTHKPLKTTAPTPVGKYLVSTLVRPAQTGGYTAGVSIRSGRGSASTDRVMHFHRHFNSAPAAHRYAHAQGIEWVAARAMPVNA